MYKVCIGILVLFMLSCESKAEEKTIDRLKQKAVLAKAYCEKNNMNMDICILVDMKIHSGKKRFFLWDLKGDSILKSGVCTHGSCDNLADYDPDKAPQFSNTPESYCSSLGKYKLGSRGYSNFGVNFNYKLHGLEKTNSNAYKRTVVFHSWNLVDDEEIYPNELVMSYGCPSISNKLMLELDKTLKTQKKSVLFWIYN